MRQRVSFGAVWVVGTLALATVALGDTLVLRNGRRVHGELVGVGGDAIEFRSGGWSGRTERYDREQVRSIEFDGRGDGRHDGGRDDDRYSGGRPPAGLRERSVSVGAYQPWTNTNVEVRRGQDVYFGASGQVRWGKDRKDGPAGEHNSPRNPGRPIPNRPGAALIGRIDNGDPFFIGDERGPIRMRDSGRLYLGINDDYLQDNSGEFRVTVRY